MKGWQHRWFILDPESGMLEYFEVNYTLCYTEPGFVMSFKKCVALNWIASDFSLPFDL